MLDRLAEELREARKKTGLSLLQVSAKSKIDIKFLEAMEKGNFSFLPEIYVKAFIKDFSNIVDLNPDLMLKKYDAYKMGRNYEEVKPPEIVYPTTSEGIRSDESIESREKGIPKRENIITGSAESSPKKRKSFKYHKREKSGSSAQNTPIQTFDAVARKTSMEPDDEKRRRNLMLGFAGAAVFILLLLVYFLFFKKDTEIVVTERPIEEVIKENKERFSEPARSSIDKQEETQTGDSLSLLIKANDTSWVKIILDDSDEEEFILFPQSQKIIKTGNNYKITFGNYSQIELSLNNEPLDLGNNRKSVVHVLIDSTGLKYLNAPPVIE
jgi:cytoskeletal protein RodZ